MRWIGLLFLTAAASLTAWAQSTTPQRAQQARDLVVAGKPEQAIPIYEELLRTEPQNAGLMLNLAVAQFQAGRYQDVITQTQKTLAIQPDLLAARLFLGAAYLKSGDAANAIGPLQQVVGAQPDDRNARLMLAEALSHVDRDDEAVAHFLTVSQQLPNEPRVWYGLARACETIARDSLRKLQASAPDSPYHEALAGGQAQSMGRYAAAIRHYQRALTATDAARFTYQSMGEIYRATGHADWAAQVENRVAKLPPLDCKSAPQSCAFANANYVALLLPPDHTPTPQALYWKAKACTVLNSDALERLSKLPESIQFHELKASELENRGIHQEAVEHWRKAIRLDPNNRPARKGLAASLYQAADFGQAVPLLQELLRGDPNSAELNLLCGNSLLLNEQPEESLPYLRKAAETDPNSQRTQAALGQALLALASYEQAIPHLIAALPSDEDGRIAYQLARAYQGTQQQELAEKALERYRETRRASEARRRAMENVVEIEPPR